MISWYFFNVSITLAELSSISPSGSAGSTSNLSVSFSKKEIGTPSFLANNAAVINFGFRSPRSYLLRTCFVVPRNSAISSRLMFLLILSPFRIMANLFVGGTFIILGIVFSPFLYKIYHMESPKTRQEQKFQKNFAKRLTTRNKCDSIAMSPDGDDTKRGEKVGKGV